MAMISSDPDGRSRPLRVAGLALLGVAVGAALVGLVSLGSGGGDGGDAAPTSEATSEAPPADDPTGGQPTGEPTGEPTQPTAPASPTTTATPPPAPTSAAPQPPPPEPKAPLRVYNNSKIAGLAAQAADDFRRFGWTVEEVSNYSAGIIPTSTVYYQPGAGQEAAAQALANRFNLRVEPRFDGIAGASPGLIVIVTNDYGSK